MIEQTCSCLADYSAQPSKTKLKLLVHTTFIPSCLADYSAQPSKPNSNSWSIPPLFHQSIVFSVVSGLANQLRNYTYSHFSLRGILLGFFVWIGATVLYLGSIKILCTDQLDSFTSFSNKVSVLIQLSVNVVQCCVSAILVTQPLNMITHASSTLFSTLIQTLSLGLKQVHKSETISVSQDVHQIRCPKTTGSYSSFPFLLRW